MKKLGGEPIDPTTTIHSGFSECSELAGLGGSIAGCASVTAGTGVCIVRSTTVRVDWVKRWEHGADVCTMTVGACRRSPWAHTDTELVKLEDGELVAVAEVASDM